MSRCNCYDCTDWRASARARKHERQSPIADFDEESSSDDMEWWEYPPIPLTFTDEQVKRIVEILENPPPPSERLRKAFGR